MKFKIGDYVLSTFRRDRGKIIQISYNNWDDRYQYLVLGEFIGKHWVPENYMVLLEPKKINNHPLTKIFI